MSSTGQDGDVVLSGIGVSAWWDSGGLAGGACRGATLFQQRETCLEPLLQSGETALDRRQDAIFKTKKKRPEARIRLLHGECRSLILSKKPFADTTNRSEDIQYKYNIRNILQSYDTQKTLYSFLVSIGFQHIIILKRITSLKIGKPTLLIRVITHHKKKINHLLIYGITVFGRTYYTELSNPPTPAPVQCSRCFQFGHALADYRNKPICPKCPNSHPPNKCPEATPSWPCCQRNHPAWSRLCPKFKELIVTDEIPVLRTKIIDPPAEFADPVEPNDDDDSVNISPTESIPQAKAIIASFQRPFWISSLIKSPKSRRSSNNLPVTLSISDSKFRT
ncbi:hypothetical protein BDFB_009949 [Asbolus verrucosus]|uniref:Uncharacterized protein n=1 Tax=Asbolus verrucosus TaxID=1661398 RepID=A0A482WF16_ASBVE|nr:hypothetical protein BDFB_009949 [Asbolus verrucosus]